GPTYTCGVDELAAVRRDLGKEDVSIALRAETRGIDDGEVGALGRSQDVRGAGSVDGDPGALLALRLVLVPSEERRVDQRAVRADLGHERVLMPVLLSLEGALEREVVQPRLTGQIDVSGLIRGDVVDVIERATAKSDRPIDDRVDDERITGIVGPDGD